MHLLNAVLSSIDQGGWPSGACMGTNSQVPYDAVYIAATHAAHYAGKKLRFDMGVTHLDRLLALIERDGEQHFYHDRGETARQIAADLAKNLQAPQTATPLFTNSTSRFDPSPSSSHPLSG